MSTAQLTRKDDAAVRQKQTLAVHVITDLYARSALPPLPWRISCEPADVLGDRLQGQVPMHFGVEAHRRAVLAQYADALGTAPTERGDWLDLWATYAGVRVHIYTLINSEEVPGE